MLFSNKVRIELFRFADENRNLRNGVDLKYSYDDVSLLQKGENFDLLTRGLSTQHSYASDAYHEVDVSQISLMENDFSTNEFILIISLLSIYYLFLLTPSFSR